jgi:hypothetical protein
VLGLSALIFIQLIGRILKKPKPGGKIRDCFLHLKCFLEIETCLISPPSIMAGSCCLGSTAVPTSELTPESVLGQKTGTQGFLTQFEKLRLSKSFLPNFLRVQIMLINIYYTLGSGNCVPRTYTSFFNIESFGDNLRVYTTFMLILLYLEPNFIF